MGNHFTENRGQLGADVGMYYAHGQPLTVTFGKGWMGYHLRSDDGAGVMVRMTFPGSNDVEPVGERVMTHALNYFSGNDPAGWCTGVRNWERVVYPDLWDGIDLEYYFDDGLLKYDLIVGPIASPSSIRFVYEGVAGLSLDPTTGDLLIRTAAGVLRDMAPRSTTTTSVGNEEVWSSFLLEGSNTVSFIVGDYDSDSCLTIDPGLVFSSFLGGSKGESIYEMDLDAQGNIYVLGMSSSLDFPTTPGAYSNATSQYGTLFVTKMDQSGTTLVYSTMINGWIKRTDIAAGRTIPPKVLRVDTQGNAVICGNAGPSTPVTNGTYDTTPNGDLDLFVLKLNDTGSGILFSTLLGGSGEERITGLRLDGVNNIYVAGTTNSTDFPTTSGAPDQVVNDTGTWAVEAYIAKLSANGTQLLYSTYIGGSDYDRCYALHVDASGNAYVTGPTFSPDFNITAGAYDTGRRGGTEIYFQKHDTVNSTLEFSGRFGGDYLDYPCDLILDDAGDIYIAGYTDSDDFPTTSGAFDTIWKLGEGFVAKLSGDGSKMRYSTYVGATKVDMVAGISLDGQGCAYLTGTTWSRDFNVTEGALNETYGASGDAFLVKLSPDFSTLIYSTFLGGSDDDVGMRVFVNGTNQVYVVGWTKSPEFPSSTGSYDSVHNGTRDGFILSVNVTHMALKADNSPSVAFTGDPYTFNMSVAYFPELHLMTVEYWYGGSTNHTLALFSLTNGTKTVGDWERTIDVPSDSVEPLYYIVNLTDTTGFRVNMPMRTVQVLDNDGPMLEDRSRGPATTGDMFTFNVSAIDNIALDTVSVSFWFGNDTANTTNIKMTPVELGSARGGYHVHQISVPHDLTMIHYTFWANDSYGNWNDTSVFKVTVESNDLPYFGEDGTSSIGTTGDELVFAVTVQDNMGLEAVRVTYQFGDGPSTDVPLSLKGSDTWEVTITLGNTLEDLRYRFTARDTSGNENSTVWRTVTITDNDPPEVVEDQSDTTATTGDPFTLWVEVTDNIGMGAARVVHWFTGGERVTAVLELQYVSGGRNWTYGGSLDVPNDSNASLHYLLELTDAAGNTLRTGEREVPVLDDEPPTFGTDLSDEEAFRNQMFHFDVEFDDNIGVFELRCEWWFGEGEHLNATVPLDTTIAIDVPLHPEEPLRYLFSARDAAGNWNSTVVFERPVPNRPPAVGLPNPWEVGEEVDEELDMRDWILDPDSPWDEITVECHDPNVTVVGLVLRLRHDAWVPDYMIGVSVSDGNSSVLTFTTVHVVPVNDAPVIDQVLRNGNSLDPSVEVLTLRRGGDDDLHVRATDEDGDDLSYRWLRDGQVVATGDTVRAEDLPLGSYILRVEVDDGTETVSADLAVQVTEREEETSDWWVWTLLIVIVVALAIAGFVYWKSMDQTR